jgi:uncharacterized protein (TIGR02646 family)
MADSGPGGRQRLRDRREYETKQAFSGKFPPHWTNADVKGLLHAMQGRICAYCGMITNGLDVEHFRPKGAIDDEEAHGGYWWLAYECSNYLLGCTVCNRIRKKTSFPLLLGATRCTYPTRDMIAAEGRVLLDPVEDPVEEWLTIDPHDVTGRLIPNPALNPGERLRVQEAVDLFGLNLDLVRSQRSKAYEEAARAVVEERWDDLRQNAMRHRPHSLAARIILQRKAPERLPRADEEMKDLVDSLWRDLRTQVYEIRDLRTRGRTIRPVDERQLHTLGWALVVLRSDPPAGDPSTADAYLGELLEHEEAETRTEILELFRELQTSELI